MTSAGAAAPRSREPRSWPRRLARALLLGLLALLGSALVALAVLVLYPVRHNFVPLQAGVLHLGPDDVPRFQPNLRDEPYLHGGPGDPRYEELRLSTNGEGFRDRDHPREKPAGAFRVAFCGDSFVFGMDLADADTLPRRLEQEFASRGGLQGRPVEVFNFGLPGLNFEGMARVAEAFAVPYAPDVVLFSYISDDISYVDVIASLRWRRAVEAHLSFLPQGAFRYVRDHLTWRYKAFRYRFEFALFDLVPSLYVERLRVVLDYVSRLADTHGFQAALVDFSRRPQLGEALEAHNAGRALPVGLVTGFPIELNPRNEHPTAACTHALAPVLADEITRMAQRHGSPPR